MFAIFRYLMLGLAWLCCGLGLIGIVVPVLPTTPLLLLSTFLFAKFSPHMHAWIVASKPYQHYVQPFKDDGGLPLNKKIRILVISYTVMGISVIVAKKLFVSIILLCVCVFLLYLMFIRIPTIKGNDSCAPFEGEDA
jgi:hypothetical protein